jgi:hypothetical protein
VSDRARPTAIEAEMTTWRILYVEESRGLSKRSQQGSAASSI